MPQNDPALLSRLKEHQVEFVIIGGVCGILHGIPLVTMDLDICCRFNRENLRCLEAALKDLNPRHRLTTQKLPLELTDELCDSLKNLYLVTDWGILDCLGAIAGLGNYEQVLAGSIPYRVPYGEFRILSLDALITAKSAAGREKDLAAVRLLRCVQEKRKQQGELL